MEAVREPAVAGTFYPNDPVALSSLIDTYLEGNPVPSEAPKALIAPHAGYAYSGPVAGSAYRLLSPAHARIKHVVLLGPSHRVAFEGMAVPYSASFRTPLGDIPLAKDRISRIAGHHAVHYRDDAHAEEHSLEVHLPFLQRVIDDFDLVPVVVGDASREEVADVVGALWGEDDTLIVISTDLSHYLPYEQARRTDANTCRKIEQLDSSLIGQEACGSRAINGLLHHLKRNGMDVSTVEVSNSGDTAGDHSRVVGYGAWAISGEKKVAAQESWSLAERQTLLQLAREAIRSPLEGEERFNLNLDRFQSHIKEERASFVTLNIDGQLRGCIGSLTAHRPLVLDVAHNAQAAAFKDPRFRAVSHEEYQQLDVHISILSKPTPLLVDSRSALEQALRPGIDGLIIKEGARQSTYLPSVWTQLPDPGQFVRELRRKAGLHPDGWNQNTEVFTYTTVEFA